MQLDKTGATGNMAVQTQTGRTSLNSDYETFLKMLTVQMTNQDPLNPVDSADYAVQLATFSSVEQQVMTNDLLVGLSLQMATMGLSQLAGWVGMEVQSIAPVQFDGAPVDVRVTPDPMAERRDLVVTGRSGTEIARRPIDPASDQAAWDGHGADGRIVGAGLYSFHTESFSETGDLLNRNPATTFGRVVEAGIVGTEIQLVLSGGAEIGSGEVLGLREPVRTLSQGTN